MKDSKVEENASDLDEEDDLDSWEELDEEF